MLEHITSLDSFAPPSDPLDAWAEAEHHAIMALCEATGHEYGVNAFVGELDDILNSFYFFNSQLDTGGSVMYAPQHPTFCLPYSAIGTFDSRRGIMRWGMSIIDALPLRKFGNVCELRVTNRGVGPVQMASYAMRGETAPTLCYRLRMDFDLVFAVR